MKFWNKFLKLDGRWFLGGSHITLILVAIIFFKLQRTVIQVAFGLLTIIIFELIFNALTDKYSEKKYLDRVFSSVTEGAGLLVLLKSHLWWFYGAMGFFTIAAKYLLRKNKSSHIFNPTNFSITFALIVFPIHWFEARPDDFMVHWYPMLHVTLFGICATYLGKTWKVSLSYILSVTFWSLVFFPLNSVSNLIFALLPEFGAIGLIFLWLMITDPKTAPKSTRGQILYAFSIAFIHILLRYNEYLYSRYIALFIVTILYYGVSSFWENKRQILPRTNSLV